MTALLLMAAACSQGQCTSTKPVPTPTATGQTVLDLQGSGNRSTDKFTVPAHWAVGWTYDCRSGLTQNGALPSGAHCTFTLTVKTPDGNASAQNQPVFDQDAVGQGVAVYHTGGTFYLTLGICCTVNTWSLRVIALSGT